VNGAPAKLNSFSVGAARERLALACRASAIACARKNGLFSQNRGTTAKARIHNPILRNELNRLRASGRLRSGLDRFGMERDCNGLQKRRTGPKTARDSLQNGPGHAPRRPGPPQSGGRAVPDPSLHNTRYTLAKLCLPFWSALHNAALYGIHSFPRPKAG
jgi:hypothetical protein